MQFPKNQTSKFSFIAKTLAYKDPLRVQPTHVSVRNLVARSRLSNSRTYASVEVSDHDDDDDGLQDDLVENAIVSFRRLPVPKAIEEVSEAMVDW